MSELEEYKEEKPESEEVVSEPKDDPKKKMSLTTKIIIGLIILCFCVLIFKVSYNPKPPAVPKRSEPVITTADSFSSNYDLKSEVSRFLQKQIEYIM